MHACSRLAVLPPACYAPPLSRPSPTRRRRWPNAKRFALLVSPLLIPFCWFELLSNHTQIHTWMVYRTAASCFGILIAAAIIASRDAETAGSNGAQQKKRGVIPAP